MGSTETKIRTALIEHGYRGTVDGPGYRAVICRCRAEFTSSEGFAQHQAEHVMAAIQTKTERVR